MMAFTGTIYRSWGILPLNRLKIVGNAMTPMTFSTRRIMPRATFGPIFLRTIKLAWKLTVLSLMRQFSPSMKMGTAWSGYQPSLSNLNQRTDPFLVDGAQFELVSDERRTILKIAYRFFLRTSRHPLKGL